jgi:hypothetical protein
MGASFSRPRPSRCPSRATPYHNRSGTHRRTAPRGRGPSLTSSAAIASRSTHNPARETPRGCRPVCRTRHADVEIDSAMRTSARRPTATARDHCRAWCGAWPARPRCDARATRSESLRRHSHDRRLRRPAGTGVGRVRLAEAESHRPTRGLLGESFRLAPVKRIASGTPCASQIKCRLLPRLARSVGFGPVSVPPHTARTEQLSTMARDQSM